MAEQSRAGLYEPMPEEEVAEQMLDPGGFPITRDATVAQYLGNDQAIHNDVTMDELVKQGAGLGAVAGGLFGLPAGAGFFWVLGAGVMAAALLGGIEGALAGAAFGSVIGMFASWAMFKVSRLRHKTSVTHGQRLVIAPHSAAEVVRAHAVLQGERRIP